MGPKRTIFVRVLPLVALLTACGSSGNGSANQATQPLNSSTAPATAAPVGPPTPSAAVVAGIHNVNFETTLVDEQGYIFYFTISGTVGPPTLDITKVPPGQTAVRTWVRGVGAIENRTPGRDAPTSGLGNHIFVYAIWPASSATCAAAARHLTTDVSTTVVAITGTRRAYCATAASEVVGPYGGSERIPAGGNIMLSMNEPPPGINDPYGVAGDGHIDQVLPDAEAKAIQAEIMSGPAGWVLATVGGSSTLTGRTKCTIDVNTIVIRASTATLGC